ncbi:MAG: DUF29 family protein [Mesorhizobium sp.]|uniref:DUF29 domain-containing protein n=1 Tax=Mesorhizobium sp. M2A.F.Ca.ET.043.05.1.1 TaxID=2493671 RepID=UPI000F74FC62|nr:DUF29 domain-containing protein [Mesorhizobium sp. M2A.F.Ca.ET.043.05.1.1]AZO17318.1 DUF29 domain-containing protein [Mesorhizobium sp. M2A.F.Ca.ET.043.05.1.1]TIV75807.1 MAG: DUF29 family protein [Mesorhizobium sp.]TIW29700.1 MAG: DUF29 family protein [Mesorhizobium sp.]
MNRIDRLRALTPYEADFVQWCAEQGSLLREGRLSELDRENLAEEIESLGRRDKREIRSRMEVLITHLLKWEFQPGHRCHSWQASISEQRTWIDGIIKDSPSLRRYPAQIFEEAYKGALPVAVRETGMKKAYFPSEPPFTSKQALDGRFWPGGPLSMDDFLRD